MTYFGILCRKIQQTTISCVHYAAKYVFNVIKLIICLYSYIYSVCMALAAVWRFLTLAADFFKTVPPWSTRFWLWIFGKIRTRSALSSMLKNIKNPDQGEGVCRPSRARPSYLSELFLKQKDLQRYLHQYFFSKNGYIYYPHKYFQEQKRQLYIPRARMPNYSLGLLFGD